MIALAAIDHEQHDVGFSDCLSRLLRHFAQYAVFGNWLKAAGINHQKRALANASFAVVAIARQPREVGHQGVTRARHSIE